MAENIFGECSVEDDKPYTVNVKVEYDNGDEEFNTMDFLELDTDSQNDSEPIELNNTDVMINPLTGLSVCLLCYQELEKKCLQEHMKIVHFYRKVSLKCHCGTLVKSRDDLTNHKTQCRMIKKKKKSYNQLMKEDDASELKKKRKTYEQIMKEVEILVDDSTNNVNCPECMLIIDKDSIKHHLEVVHGKVSPSSLDCQQCKRTFKNKLTLKEHIKLVHLCKEENVVCGICGHKFRSQKYLANHKRNVHPSGDKVYKCKHCGKEFKSRLCVHQHEKYVHPPNDARVDCPICGKLFKSKINLQQHHRVTHGPGAKRPTGDPDSNNR